jgi:hypothetical protein
MILSYRTDNVVRTKRERCKAAISDYIWSPEPEIQHFPHPEPPDVARLGPCQRAIHRKALSRRCA